MKIKILLFFLTITVVANSQVISKVGVRGETSYNLFTNTKDHLPTYRTVAAVNIAKFQIYGGLVFSKISEAEERSGYWFYGGDTKSRNGITGGVIGARYYQKQSKTKGFYYFIETTILNYHTCESLKQTYNTYYSKNEYELIDDASAQNKTFIIQPIMGVGGELRFYEFITLALDFGWGFTYRSLSSEDEYLLNLYSFNTNYGDKLTGVSGQVRLGLGFSF